MKLRQHVGGQQEFYLDKKEVLTSLKEVVDNEILTRHQEQQTILLNSARNTYR